jgi:hypothetical protein
MSIDIRKYLTQRRNPTATEDRNVSIEQASGDAPAARVAVALRVAGVAATRLVLPTGDVEGRGRRHRHRLHVGALGAFTGDSKRHAASGLDQVISRRTHQVTPTWEYALMTPPF